MTERSFPREYAETQSYSLGRPRSFTAGDGRVLFLRSRGGTDPVNCLWVLDDDGERMVCDPLLLVADGTDLTPEERARRERARERAAGITTYAADDALQVVAFALSGRLGVAEVDGPARLVDTAAPVNDPRPSPDGTKVAYVSNGELQIASLDGTVIGTVAGPDGTSCGLPEFIASEELDRFRGWWWSPDSSQVLAAVVDESAVQVWHIADPAHPERAAAEQRYPAAGTPNAVVSLLLSDGTTSEPVTGWDTDTFPYLVTVTWSADGPALLLVADRAQQRHRVLQLHGGVATVVREDTSDTFLDVTPGVPRWLADGRLLHVVDDTAADVRRLAVDGAAVSPADVHVAAVRGLDPDGDVVFIGTQSDDPTSRHVFAWDGAKTERLTEDPGVYDVVAGGDTQVGLSSSMEHFGPAAEVLLNGETVSIWSHAATPPFVPSVRFLDGDGLHVAVLLPTDHVEGTRLPVLMDPYGGPHASMNLHARNGWLEVQWWADQGFAVVVADGRGTPGRGLAWEKSVRHDFTITVDDQATALSVAAQAIPDLDTSRVGVRGWSFGGYLAALAVLARPEIFHAAIAGAPVTEWRLYDTGYTERYLGTEPEGADRETYDRNSLIPLAKDLRRPLLLIHGLADDNVVAAHTLQLSAELVAHGRPHDVLPLPGATHLGGGPVIRENLLLLQREWLTRNLPTT